MARGITPSGSPRASAPDDDASPTRAASPAKRHVHPTWESTTIPDETPGLAPSNRRFPCRRFHTCISRVSRLL